MDFTRPPESDPDCRPWYDEAFGRHYLDLYDHRDAAAAEGEAAFAASELGLERGHLVLDLSCGPGHHLASLEKRGLRTLGLDRSRSLLDCLPPGAPGVRGDMRRLPLRGPFDAVVTFFTTLGYFEEADNRRVLGEISRILRPGGRFLIDHLNGSRVRRTLVPRSSRAVGTTGVVETRWIEEDPPRVLKTVRFLEKDVEVRCYTESVRLYGAEELKSELTRAGLAVKEVFGDFDGSPFDETSRRMILTGVKG